MQKLEQLVAHWRKQMATTSGFDCETLDELESHVRDTVNQFLRLGADEQEAFQRAVEQLGSFSTISSEFQKLKRKTWLPVKLAVGGGIAAAVGLALSLVGHFQEGGLNLLLASHVFTLTLGYMNLLLAGALGVCFVCRRGFSEFSIWRTESVCRTSVAFTKFGAGLTGVGIILGVLWSRIVLGRFWGWDLNESGALCVLVWSMCSIAVHRLHWNTAHAALLMGILGNAAVSLAWLGPTLLVHTQTSGVPRYSLLLCGSLFLNLASFLIGLTPAGWFRLTKT
jgi:hypothetical protein